MEKAGSVSERKRKDFKYPRQIVLVVHARSTSSTCQNTNRLSCFPGRSGQVSLFTAGASGSTLGAFFFFVLKFLTDSGAAFLLEICADIKERGS